MSVGSFGELHAHVGHEIECVAYGTPAENVAVECVTCATVLFDFDRPYVPGPIPGQITIDETEE